MMIRILCMSVVVTALAAATPAQAQSRRELAERIDATEVRIGELENQFLAGDPACQLPRNLCPPSCLRFWR